MFDALHDHFNGHGSHKQCGNAPGYFNIPFDKGCSMLANNVMQRLEAEH